MSGPLKAIDGLGDKVLGDKVLATSPPSCGRWAPMRAPPPPSWLPPAPPKRNARYGPWRRRSGPAAPAILAANGEDLADAERPARRAAFVDRLTLDQKRIAVDCGRHRHDCRRSPTRSAPSWRPGTGRTACGSSGCGCRSASSASSTRAAPTSRRTPVRWLQGRQCRHPARRVGQLPLVARHSRRAGGRPVRRRPAGHRDPAGADPRSRCRRADAGRARRRDRRDRAARRQGPGGPGAGRGAPAGVRPSRRQLPCLCGQGGRSRHGESDRAQCQDAAHRRLRRRRDLAGRPRRRARPTSRRWSAC